MGAGDRAAENAVADKLGELVPRGWRVLHNVPWPGRPNAWLDHVLVGPGGVVVVDDKNWAGLVSVSSGVLWQGRYARNQSVESALAQCAAVASVLAPQYRRLVRPLICMSGQPDLFGVTSSDVAVSGTGRVVGAVESLPTELGEDEVVELHAYLGRQFLRGPEAGLTALRPVRPRTAARAAMQRATELPPAERIAPMRRPADAPVGRHPLRRRSGAAGRHGAAGEHGTAGQQRQASAAGRLALLAAFITFAVYVLPYWMR